MLISLARCHLQYGTTTSDWLYSYGKPLQYSVLYFIIYNHFSSEKDVRKILFVNIIISLILCVIMLIKFRMLLVESGYMHLQSRTGGLISNPNIITILFVINIPIILLLFETTKKLGIRIFLILTLLTLSAGVVFSYSRTAYFTLIFAMVCYYLLNKKAIKTILIIMVIGFIIPFLPETVIERAKSVAELDSEGVILGRSTENRLELMNGGRRYLMDAPHKIIVGGGVGDYEYNAHRYSYGILAKEGRDPHNFLISLISQVGLLGCIIIGFFYYKILKLCKAIKKQSNLFDGKFASVIQVQILAYFIFSMAHNFNLVWSGHAMTITFLSMLGCVLILHRNFKSRVSENEVQVKL
jgi:hypothetical protein